MGLAGFEGLPSINAQNEPNHDRFTGALFLGGWALASAPGPDASGSTRSGWTRCGGFPSISAQNAPSQERFSVTCSLAGGVPLNDGRDLFDRLPPAGAPVMILSIL